MAKTPKVFNGLSPAKLRAKIEESGLTQEAVAQQVGIHRPNLNRILAGVKTNVKLSLAQSLAHVLGCTVDELLK
jgi:DNA-binding XRE family transcriptional regulator